MGRFFLILGIILIVVGMVAPFASMGNFLPNISNIMSLATDTDAREAELCEEDETLEEEQGEETYTPGQGYGRPTTLYCVDKEGHRRNVTGDLIEGMLGTSDPEGITNMVENIISQSFIFVGLSCLGFFLVFMGLIMMRGKRQPMMMVNSYGFNPMPMQTPMQPMQTPQQQGVNVQLQQLEQAYNQNLLTREEYEKKRQELLNKF